MSFAWCPWEGFWPVVERQALPFEGEEEALLLASVAEPEVEGASMPAWPLHLRQQQPPQSSSQRLKYSSWRGMAP